MALLELCGPGIVGMSYEELVRNIDSAVYDFVLLYERFMQLQLEKKRRLKIGNVKL